MKGDTASIMAEFVTIASVLMEEANITEDMLKIAIDIAYINNEADKTT